MTKFTDSEFSRNLLNRGASAQEQEKNASLLNRVTQGMDWMCKRQSVPFGVTHLKADCFEEAHKFKKSHSGKDMACRKNCG